MVIEDKNEFDDSKNPEMTPKLTLTTQVTLNEEIVAGSRLSLSVTLEGIIPIKIPCLDIGGTNLGSW